VTLADRYSVCQYTTWHQSFEEDIEQYVRLGVHGIEVCELKLSSDAGRRHEQLALVDDAGIEVTSFQPRVPAVFHDSAFRGVHDPAERAAHFRRTIDLVAEVYPGREIPLVTITGEAPGYDFAHAHRTLREIYRGLCDYAGERGLRIAFEPLSPIYMNTDTFICTLDGALELIADVGRPNFGLLLDCWHVWDEPMIHDRIADLGDCLFGVHVSDWRRGGPQCQADRHIPGTGVIDFTAFLAAVDRAGYAGSICLEIHSADELPDSLRRIDQNELIVRSRDALELAASETPVER
jgi:sugar phosphate isomerase/epimerase